MNKNNIYSVNVCIWSLEEKKRSRANKDLSKATFRPLICSGICRMNRSSQCINKHLHIDFLLEEQSEWRHWKRQTLSKPSEQKLSIFVWLSKCFLQILLEKIFLPLTVATASTLDNRLLLLTNISTFHYHLLGSARFNLQHSGISWYQVVHFLPSRCEHCGPDAYPQFSSKYHRLNVLHCSVVFDVYGLCHRTFLRVTVTALSTLSWYSTVMS